MMTVQTLMISSPVIVLSALTMFFWLGIGLLFILLYSMTVFSKPQMTLLVFVFILTFHDFLNLPVTGDGFKLSTAILLSAFFIILAKIIVLKAPDLYNVLSRKVNILVLLFLFAMVISIVNSQKIEFAVVDIQKFMYCSLLYFFVLFTLKDASLLKRVIIALVCGGFIVSLLGLVEAGAGTFYGLFRDHSLLGADVPKQTLLGPPGRINGVLGDADLHGIFMGMVFLFSLYLFFVSTSKMLRLFLCGTMLLCAFNVIGAASRGAALGSFISFAIFWLYVPLRRKWLILTAITGCALVLGFLAMMLYPDLEIERFYRPEGQAKKTLELRKNNVLIGLAMVLDHPIIGHGPGGFTIVYHKYASEAAPSAEKKSTRPLNVYIQVLVDYGIVGLFLFLGIIFSAMKKLFPLARSKLGEFSLVALALLAALCGYSVFMLFTGLINDQIYWLLIALAVAIGTFHVPKVVAEVR